MLCALGCFGQLFEGKMLTRRVTIAPRRYAFWAFGRGAERQCADPIIAGGKDQVDVAWQAVAHCLVHQVLAPTIGSRVTDPAKDGKAFFCSECAFNRRLVEWQCHRIDGNAIRTGEVAAS